MRYQPHSASNILKTPRPQQRWLAGVFLCPGAVGFRQSGDEGSAPVFQPFPMAGIIGAMLCHLCPEAGGVVHMLPVAQLVDHHIIPDLRGREHQQAVEIQVATVGAAAPAGSLGPDGDVFKADPHLGCPEAYPAGKVLFGLLLQLCQLPGSQRGQGTSVFLKLPPKPGFLGSHKIPDGLLGQAAGCPHRNGAVGPDFQGKGLPGAADEGIGNVQENHLRNGKWAVLQTAPTQTA